MRNTFLALATSVGLLLGAQSALADAAKPGQSMTHMKTVSGVASTLEGLGVILYVQGGATAALAGDSLGASDGQVVFHIPVTGTKNGVQHVGSNIVFFNTANNKQVQLRNPVIDLSKGVVSAVIPQGSGELTPVLRITNAENLKAAITNDRKAQLKTKAYKGAALSLEPGIATALNTLLGLSAGAIPDNLAFATADVSLYSKLKSKK